LPGAANASGKLSWQPHQTPSPRALRASRITQKPFVSDRPVPARHKNGHVSGKVALALGEKTFAYGKFPFARGKIAVASGKIALALSEIALACGKLAFALSAIAFAHGRKGSALGSQQRRCKRHLKAQFSLEPQM
jgi:hypothetical protein